jgi:rhodanese-related sulfurtransferase
MSKPQPQQKPLTIAPLVAAGVLVAALLGFAFWRMSRSAAPAAPEQTAAAATAAAPAVGADDAARAAMPRISVTDLHDRLAKHEVTLLDVRDADAYLEAHIPGSMHIPLARIDSEIQYLPKGKPFVTYCTCPHDEAAADANMILNHGGIPNALALAGGLGAWQKAGYPIANGEQ